MDITLIRTFIEVANTGSFVAACDRLFVTQSAVSLRIQRLEDSHLHLRLHNSSGRLGQQQANRLAKEASRREARLLARAASAAFTRSLKMKDKKL